MSGILPENSLLPTNDRKTSTRSYLQPFLPCSRTPPVPGPGRLLLQRSAGRRDRGGGAERHAAMPLQPRGLAPLLLAAERTTDPEHLSTAPGRIVPRLHPRGPGEGHGALHVHRGEHDHGLLPHLQGCHHRHQMLVLLTSKVSARSASGMSCLNGALIYISS